MALEERPVARNALVGMIDEAAQVRLLECDDLVPTSVPVARRGPHNSRKVRDADHRAVSDDMPTMLPYPAGAVLFTGSRVPANEAFDTNQGSLGASFSTRPLEATICE